MYDNIGKKIKSIAKTVAIVLTCCFAVVFIIAASRSGGWGVLVQLIYGGILIFIVWVGSFFMYAFGEFIEKMSDIERNTRVLATKIETPVKDLHIEKMQKLRSMLDQGLISEEEYKEQKKKIIESI